MGETKQVKFSELCRFFDRQIEATKAADSHQYTLYGGSRGPGKSYWLRWYDLRELLKFGQQGLKGVCGGLFCENYTVLTDRQIARIAEEFPRYLGELRETRIAGLGFHLKPEYGGGHLLLRNLDEPSKYLSAEFAFVSVDELTRNPLDVFNKLRGSLRWPGVDKPKFLAATNPGGIGHNWVRAYWLAGELPPELEGYRSEFAFVPALPTDNPYLSKDYWEMLGSLPPDLARAWRYGDWDVFEGQYFTELRRDIHGFEGDPPNGWTFRMLDYGESSPSAVYWGRVDHDGGVWLYREVYKAGLSYIELADRIVEMSVDRLGRPEPTRYTVAGPEMWGVSKGTGVVGANVLAARGVPLVMASDDRIEGWRRMREMLRRQMLKASLEACPHFWRTVPSLIHDEHRPEDLDSDGEDHAADAVRYGLATRHISAQLYGFPAVVDEDAPRRTEPEPSPSRAGGYY